MGKYVLRLDDAAPYLYKEKWQRMERLLDRYSIKPLVGIIPDCKDEELLKYPKDDVFWQTARTWQAKGWSIALHGYEHTVLTNHCDNCLQNLRSEFAGVGLTEQQTRIKAGFDILKQQGLHPIAFFTPFHTFDDNTVSALLNSCDIRIISDTFAFAPYQKNGITVVPQQVNHVRKMPFKITTFCYHPNKMNEEEYRELESFLKIHASEFIWFPIYSSRRKISLAERCISHVLQKIKRYRNWK